MDAKRENKLTINHINPRERNSELENKGMQEKVRVKKTLEKEVNQNINAKIEGAKESYKERQQAMNKQNPSLI